MRRIRSCLLPLALLAAPSRPRRASAAWTNRGPSARPPPSSWLDDVRPERVRPRTSLQFESAFTRRVAGRVARRAHPGGAASPTLPEAASNRTDHDFEIDATITDAEEKSDDILVPFDLPRHVAFICDGNSRWATRQGHVPEFAGHAAGADRAVRLIESLRRYRSTAPSKCRRIECCTLFAFSTENWSRPHGEIATLFNIIERMARQYRTHDAVRGGTIKIELLGDLDDERIPEGARGELRSLERESGEASRRRSGRAADVGDDEGEEGDEGLTVCLAINYGGRADLLRAASSLAASLTAGDLPPDEELTESHLASRLRTSSLPCDPDLIVRTGGERRLSNFLLWDAAYAELYFDDVPWPDFDDGRLGEALAWYGGRGRRFGGR